MVEGDAGKKEEKGEKGAFNAWGTIKLTASGKQEVCRIRVKSIEEKGKEGRGSRKGEGRSDRSVGGSR